MRVKFTGIIFGIILSLLTTVFIPLSVFAAQEQEITIENSKIEPELQKVMDAAEEDEWIAVYLELSEVENMAMDELLESAQTPEEKLAIIEGAYSVIADAFVEKYFDESERDRIIYQGGYTTEVVEKIEKGQLEDRGLLNSYRTVTKYTSTIAVQATKDEILAYAMDDDVTVLSLYGLIPETSVSLTEARAAAKMELTYYKEATQYRKAQQMEIQKIVDDGFAAIDEAESVDDVRVAVQKAEAKMDKVKTDRQLTEEELAGKPSDDKDESKDLDVSDDPLKDKDEQESSGAEDGKSDGDVSGKDMSSQDTSNKDISDKNVSDEDSSNKDTSENRQEGSSDKTSDKNVESDLSAGDNEPSRPDGQSGQPGEETDITQEPEVIQPNLEDAQAADDNRFDNDMEPLSDGDKEQLAQELDKVQKMTADIRSYLRTGVVLILTAFLAATGYGIWLHKKKK